jgi:predicted dehydrogenase
MSDRRLQTALFGLGRVGMGYAEDPLTAKWLRYSTHAQVLADHPRFEWVAAVDPSGDARARAGSRWSPPLLAESVDALAAQYEPDVAVISTPPGERSAIVARLPSLRAVLVEKPLGRNVAEAEDFLALCADRGILVQVNLWRRGDALFRELAEGRLAAEIGRPQIVFGVYGNGLLNNGVHLVDLLAMLAGDVALVQALPGGGTATGPIAGDLDIPFAAELAGGVPATVLPLDFRHYREVGLDLWGQSGRLSILQEGLAVTVYPRTENRSAGGEHEIASDRPTLLPSTLGYAFHRLYTNLADAVLGNDELWSPGSVALRAERIVAAVEHSRSEGNVVVECP